MAIRYYRVVESDKRGGCSLEDILNTQTANGFVLHHVWSGKTLRVVFFKECETIEEWTILRTADLMERARLREVAEAKQKEAEAKKLEATIK